MATRTDAILARCDEPIAGRSRSVNYGLPVKALRVWMKDNLLGEACDGGGIHYNFRFIGSTCSWGGQRVNALMHAIVQPSPEGYVFEKGWIELPSTEAGTHFSCAYQKQGARFLMDLRQTPEFTGMTLDQILATDMDLNPAGCLCKAPMINHKWRVMIATMHFALHQRSSRSEAA